MRGEVGPHARVGAAFGTTGGRVTGPVGLRPACWHGVRGVLAALEVPGKRPHRLHDASLRP